MLQEVVNELSKLYRLKAEGQKVDTLITSLEPKLFCICDEKMDREKANEKDKEKR